MPNAGCRPDSKSSILEDPMLEAGPGFWAVFEVVLKSMVIFDIESGWFGELYIFALKEPTPHITEGNTPQAISWMGEAVQTSLMH